MELNNTVSIVTGAYSGIGHSIALSLADAGSDIVLVGISKDLSLSVATEIEDRGRKALIIIKDLSIQKNNEDIVDEAISWQGHVDVCVMNAGIFIKGAASKISIENWKYVIDLNLWSHIWTVRKILPHMIERGIGHLVHISSTNGLLGIGKRSPYCISKYGIIGLAESLKDELKDTGVSVSIVCPSLVATNLLNRAILSENETLDYELFNQLGIHPDIVGQKVKDAILQDQFWVFTHPDTPKKLVAKWEKYL